MPSDRALKAMNSIHRAVLKISGGRFGWRVAGMPVLELTTTGRKTGQPHTVMLTAPVRLGGALVVVASRGGDNHHPGWFVNLKHDPNVQVSVEGGPVKPMRARIATTRERDELWPLIVAAHQNYGEYQARTSRVIPLVVLEQAV
jgi:deazaflavin-dependent oxidoreductase (nitroreductase family)